MYSDSKHDSKFLLAIPKVHLVFKHVAKIQNLSREIASPKTFINSQNEIQSIKF